MNYANYDDIVAQLRGAGLLLGSVKKSNGGVAVGELYVESTRSVRCDVDGENKRQSGAYWLHELRLDDGVFLTGSYWADHGNTSYKLELNKVCTACGADVPLKGAVCPSCGGKKYKAREIPKEQIEAHKARMAESRRQAEAEAKMDADLAAAWANAVWLKCREITTVDEHDYLARKKIKSTYGTRILDNHDGVMLDGAEKSDYEYLAKFHGSLVVPMLDKDGRRRGLQFILSREKHKDLIASMGRDKQSWPKGMISQGMHYLIGGQPQGVCLVAEGFATGASLHEAANLPVAVAFTANNLQPVGEKIWKSSRKRARLLYCADDDWVQRCDSKTGGCGKYTPVAEANCKHCGHKHGKKNPGVEYAKAGALATSGAWVMPQFSTPRPDDRKGATDFNDLRCIEGEQSVGGQVSAKITDLGWLTPPLAVPRAGVIIQGGGGDGFDRPAAVSVMNLDDAVARFVPIDDGVGKAMFDHWTKRIVHRDQMIAVMPAGVRADDVKRHPTWVDRGAVYLDQIGFDPAGLDPLIVLNTWNGWPLQPKKGSCELLLDLLHYLCSLEPNPEEIFNWILCWMAYPLQNPGAKMSSAIIMHGPQGTGKSAVFRALARIYGFKGPRNKNYSIVIDQKALQSKFNFDWDSKLFVLAEEIVNNQDKWQLKNEIKEMVTGDTIRVEGKFTNAHHQKNQFNLVMLSNEQQPYPLENGDRRNCVVWTPPELGQEYYDGLFVELESGGVEAFYHHLINLDLSKFHPKKRPPDTQAKRNLIEISMPSEERFMRDWMDGVITFNEEIGALPFCPCGSQDLYNAYFKWCRMQGETRPRPSNTFLGALARRHGWQSGFRNRYTNGNMAGDTKRQRMIEPSITDTTEHIKRGGKDHAQKPDESIAKWATRCFFSFHEALGAQP